MACEHPDNRAQIRTGWMKFAIEMAGSCAKACTQRLRISAFGRTRNRRAIAGKRSAPVRRSLSLAETGQSFPSFGSIVTRWRSPAHAWGEKSNIYYNDAVRTLNA